MDQIKSSYLGLLISLEKLYKKSVTEILLRLAPKPDNTSVNIFHHIPKCGGTSVSVALNEWFTVIKEYRSALTNSYPDKININRLNSSLCLCGHFETEGYYLHQRYPEVFRSDKYRIFTFVREPLELRLSLYRYEKKYYPNETDSVENHLNSQRNYLAKRFPATMENYKEIIDSYFFVGILEHGQPSLDLLAKLLNKEAITMPWINSTKTIKNADVKSLSGEFIERFKENNELDYLIYEYCIEKYKLVLDKK